MTNTSPKPVFLLIDGNAIIHRAYHALPKTLTDKDGHPTNAVFGFARIFLRALKDFKPAYAAVAFDLPAPTFRDKLLPSYKATRPKTPDELVFQIPLVKKLAENFNLPIFEKEGFEADDLIASLVFKIKKELPAAKTIILTGDNDTLQLVDEKVEVATPARGVQPAVLFDPQKIQERYGLGPEKFLDYKSLVGDTSDNVPGVRGIGPKSASELLKKFKNLEGILGAVKKGGEEIPSKIAEALLKEERRVFFNRQILGLKSDLPIELSFQKARIENYDPHALKQFIVSLNMPSLLKDLPPAHAKQSLFD